MQKLNQKQLQKVSGGGAWDEFWEDVGAWFADTIYDQAHSEHSQGFHSIGASGDLTPVSSMYPNDPLL